MIHAFLLSLLPLVPSGSPLVGSPDVDHAVPDSVLEVYDLRPLMPRFDAEGGWAHSLILPPGNGHFGDQQKISLSGLYGGEGPDVIVDLLTQVLGDELRYEGREITMDGASRLLVLAPAPIQARVAAMLQALENVLAATAQIEVDVVELTGAAGDTWPASNLVPAEAVDRAIATVLGRGGTHRRFHASLSAGRTSYVDQMRQFPILYDYDVEIAQGSFIGDPIVLEIEEGVRLFLRGVPQGDGLALSVVFQSAETRSVQEHAVGYQGAVSREESGGLTIVSGPGLVQSAEVLNRSAAFDTFLPANKAVVFASQSELGGITSTQVVFLRQVGGGLAARHTTKIPETTQSLWLVNSESLSLPTMSAVVDYPGDPLEAEGHPNVTGVLSADPSLFLFDWMKFRFSVWRRLGPWAIVITDPAWDNDAAPALEGLLASWKPRTETVGLDVTLHARGGNSRVPVRWSLPVRPGSGCALLCGISGTALFDFDVEVAQYACVADPIQASVFNGLCLGVTASRAGNGGYSLDVRGSAHLLKGGPRTTFDAKDTMMGVVEQPVIDSLLLDEERTVAVGSSLVAGGETKDGDRPVLSVEVGVR